MTNVDLTPAELEMIRLKREQEALAKKEADLQAQVRLDKEVAVSKDRVKKAQLECKNQVAKARELAKELGYAVKLTTKTEIARVYGDYIVPGDAAASDYQRTVYWEFSWEHTTAHLTHKEYTVHVREQVTYGRWSSRGTSQGYKMYISGPGIDWKMENKAYGRTSTVKEKIKSAIEDQEYARKTAENLKTSLEKTVDRFKAEYPDAVVTTDRGWEQGYGRNRYSGTTYDMVRVKFANGCNIAYRVYSDGSLKRVSFNLPGAKDEATFMKNLSQMKF